MNLNVHIERLLLEGLPINSGDAAAVRAALEQELAASLAQAAWAGTGGTSQWHADAPSIQWNSSATAAQLGLGVGRAVGAAIKSFSPSPDGASVRTSPGRTGRGT